MKPAAQHHIAQHRSCGDFGVGTAAAAPEDRPR